MKTAILLADGVKQIMFTPENDNEKQALNMINHSDHVEVAIKKGSFWNGDKERFGAAIYECQGGYLRAEERSDSVMFVLTPKNPKK